MVRRKEEAVFFTIEGFGAAAMMLLTVILVLGATTVYTSGDSHLYDMRYTQAGNDIMRVMDTPKNLTGSLQPGQSDLETMIGATNAAGFNNTFMNYLNNPKVIVTATTFGQNALQMRVNVSYGYNGAFQWDYYRLYNTSYATVLAGQVPDIRMTHWVYLATIPSRSNLQMVPGGSLAYTRMSSTNFPQPVLVEVNLWKA
jgi:hypothetical protein